MEKQQSIFRFSFLKFFQVELKTGKSYIGEWKDNKRHGYGIDKENNETYTGEFRNDKKEGNGVYCWSTNDRYEGRFVDDRQHGKKE